MTDSIDTGDTGHASAVVASGVAAGPSGAPRILVVEDDAVLASLVGSVLEDAGYRVVLTTSLSDATAWLRASTFQLMITDAFAVPGADPLEPSFVGSTTLLAVTGATPVLLYTAHPVAREAVCAAGFQDLLLKPFDLDQLEEQVARLLAGGGSSHPVVMTGADQIGARCDEETS
jgi:two-component system OmpR family response regulator